MRTTLFAFLALFIVTTAPAEAHRFGGERCIPQCLNRASDGRCAGWAPDHCSSLDGGE